MVNLKNPAKSFKHNDYVVHGPEAYQRITLKAKSKKNLENLIDELGL